jgi:hypothetical protein
MKHYLLLLKRFETDIPSEVQVVSERRLAKEKAKLEKIAALWRPEFPHVHIECRPGA